MGWVVLFIQGQFLERDSALFAQLLYEHMEWHATFRNDGVRAGGRRKGSLN